MDPFNRLQPACVVPGWQSDQRSARGSGLPKPTAGPRPLRQPDRDPADEHRPTEEPQVAVAPQEPPATPSQGYCGTEELDRGKTTVSLEQY